ncbi:hypothetical protein B0H19DRAFT_1378894 [Mycena capillaripes]|nr:hypothetical protein B0H19DRAFT_1378894 [Mycena capillaripes]
MTPVAHWERPNDTSPLTLILYSGTENFHPQIIAAFTIQQLKMRMAEKADTVAQSRAAAQSRSLLYLAPFVPLARTPRARLAAVVGPCTQCTPLTQLGRMSRLSLYHHSLPPSTARAPLRPRGSAWVQIFAGTLLFFLAIRLYPPLRLNRSQNPGVSLACSRRSAPQPSLPRIFSAVPPLRCGSRTRSCPPLGLAFHQQSPTILLDLTACLLRRYMACGIATSIPPAATPFPRHCGAAFDGNYSRIPWAPHPNRSTAYPPGFGHSNAAYPRLPAALGLCCCRLAAPPLGPERILLAARSFAHRGSHCRFGPPC